MERNEYAIPHEEFGERRRRFGAMLRERELDGALVWSKGGAALDLFGPVFYFSNHYTPSRNSPMSRRAGPDALTPASSSTPTAKQPSFPTSPITGPT